MQSYRFFFKQNQCHSKTDKTFKYWQVQKVNEIQAGGTDFMAWSVFSTTAYYWGHGLIPDSSMRNGNVVNRSDKLTFSKHSSFLTTWNQKQYGGTDIIKILLICANASNPKQVFVTVQQLLYNKESVHLKKNKKLAF